MVCQTWVKDGAGASLCGPGLRVESDGSLLDLRLRALVQDLLDLDLHLRVGALVVGRHHPHHEHCAENKMGQSQLIASVQAGA